MKNMLLLCAAAALLTTAVGCQHHNVRKNDNYLVGPACGPACETAAGVRQAGCDACGGESCDACGGYGMHQCEDCRGDGCQRCGGRGGHACGRCGGVGSMHGQHCAMRRQQRQDAHANANRPMDGGPLSAAVAYPYYTNRGPRDYFANPPRSIGP